MFPAQKHPISAQTQPLPGQSGSKRPPSADYRPQTSRGVTPAGGSPGGRVVEHLDSTLDTSAPAAVAGFDKPVTTDNWYSLVGPQSQRVGRLYFYSACGDDFYFANTCRCPIRVDGRDYSSVEHYFQCSKFGGPDSEYGAPLVGKTPAIGGGFDAVDVHHYAQQHKQQMRQGWHRIKNGYMRKGLATKFSFQQHPDFAIKLLETIGRGCTLLVEANSKDKYWGYGPNFMGENRLGLLLMERREQLYHQWMQLTTEQKQEYWRFCQRDLCLRPLHDSFEPLEASLLHFFGEFCQPGGDEELGEQSDSEQGSVSEYSESDQSSQADESDRESNASSTTSRYPAKKQRKLNSEQVESDSETGAIKTESRCILL